MFTRKRITTPSLSGDWNIDGQRIVKAIKDYFLSLESPSSLSITEATVDDTQIGGTTPAAGAFTTLSASGAVTANANVDLNGSDLIIDADGDTYLHETADDVVRMVVAGSDHTIWNATGLGIGVTPSYKLDVKGGAGNGVPAQRWEVDGGSGIYVELERDSGGGGTATFGTQTNHNLYFKVNDTVRVLLPAAGDFLQFTSAFHVTSATATGTTPAIQSGTYTPTTVAGTNCASTTGNACQWMRVGNVVNVSGSVVIDPTAGGQTTVGIPLPIASAFTLTTQLSGTSSVYTAIGANDSGVIYADSTNDRATLEFSASSVASLTHGFTFQYEVV